MDTNNLKDLVYPSKNLKHNSKYKIELKKSSVLGSNIRCEIHQICIFSVPVNEIFWGRTPRPPASGSIAERKILNFQKNRRPPLDRNSGSAPDKLKALSIVCKHVWGGRRGVSVFFQDTKFSWQDTILAEIR